MPNLENLKVGSRVLLMEFEGQPEEKATIIAIEEDDMVIAVVDVAHSPEDDGLREFCTDLIKEIL